MENINMWLEIIIEVLTGLTVAIPLVVTLYNTIKNLIKEKKWAELVKKTLEFMTAVENKYSNGADKKTLVMAMIRESAEQIGYNLDAESETKISELIDSICDASRVINSPKVEEAK